jgi:hypothetical protein
MTKPVHSPMESKDYSTGRRVVTHDIEVPDRLPHEPMQVRAQAREHSTNQWTMDVTHGPFAEKNEQGSYYTHISSTQFAGPIGKVRSGLKRSATESWKGVMDARS